jgi:hypothetical protein
MDSAVERHPREGGDIRVVVFPDSKVSWALNGIDFRRRTLHWRVERARVGPKGAAVLPVIR